MIKKILFIFIIILFTSGCYDYKEINNLIIVNGIGIDYVDSNYIVTFEILDSKNEKNDESNQGRVLTSKGKTITNAVDNITLSLEKEPYLAHLKVLVISEEIGNNHLDEVFDYFLRNNQIRNIFSVVIAGNLKPKDILNTNNKYNSVSSENIKDLLDNNEYSNYLSKNKYFKNIASNYLSGRKNITLSVIDKEEENLKLSKLAFFSNKKIKGYLDKDEAFTLSLVENDKPNANFKIKCENNKYITFNIYKSKTSKKIQDNEFILKLKLDAEVIENDCSINLENKDKQIDLENKLKKLIDKKVTELINKLKENNADILGINKLYYNKKRHHKKDYFKSALFKTETEVNINKKGLIFEINYD